MNSRRARFILLLIGRQRGLLYIVLGLAIAGGGAAAATGLVDPSGP